MKFKKVFLLPLLLLLFILPFVSSGASLGKRLAGRLLLQVEHDGAIWFVDPNTEEKIFVEDERAALGIFAKYGLGITNENLDKIPIGFDDRMNLSDDDFDGLPNNYEKALGTDPNNPDTDGDSYFDGDEVRNGFSPLGPEKMTYDSKLAERLKYKTLLQVQRHGEGWYVHADGKRYPATTPAEAMNVLRFFSLGITNENLAFIPLDSERQIAYDRWKELFKVAGVYSQQPLVPCSFLSLVSSNIMDAEYGNSQYNSLTEGDVNHFYCYDAKGKQNEWRASKTYGDFRNNTRGWDIEISVLDESVLDVSVGLLYYDEQGQLVESDPQVPVYQKGNSSIQDFFRAFQRDWERHKPFLRKVEDPSSNVQEILEFHQLQDELGRIITGQYVKIKNPGVMYLKIFESDGEVDPELQEVFDSIEFFHISDKEIIAYTVLEKGNDVFEHDLAKSRDAKRVSDIKQIQTALELYYNDNEQYAEGENLILGQPGAMCIGNPMGWGDDCPYSYMNNVPKDPFSPEEEYIFSSDSINSFGINFYRIDFRLEVGAGGFEAGPNCATPSGIKAGTCDELLNPSPTPSPQPSSDLGDLVNEGLSYGTNVGWGN